MRNGINGTQIINDRLTYNSNHIIYTSIWIIINVNDLNIPSKRLEEWRKRNTIQLYIVKKKTHQTELHRLKVKGWKEICHTNINFKKGRVGIFISDKVDFNERKLLDTKEDITK